MLGMTYQQVKVDRMLVWEVWDLVLDKNQVLDRSVDRSRLWINQWIDPDLSQRTESLWIDPWFDPKVPIDQWIDWDDAASRDKHWIDPWINTGIFLEHRSALDRSVDRSKASPIDWEHSNRSGSDRCVGFIAAGERCLRYLFADSSQISRQLLDSTHKAHIASS